jgi:hypothetical protein
VVVPPGCVTPRLEFFRTSPNVPERPVSECSRAEVHRGTDPDLPDPPARQAVEVISDSEHDVAVPGGHVHAWKSGSGPAVLLLHGGSGFIRFTPPPSSLSCETAIELFDSSNAVCFLLRAKAHSRSNCTWPMRSPSSVSLGSTECVSPGAHGVAISRCNSSSNIPSDSPVW